MPRAGLRAEGWRAYAAIVIATIAARLPFLLRADRFFDSDEAIEGLMARHLGDHSLFLWGQRYKGTPEVFLTSAVFHATGLSVVALKAVTLACFVVFLCLNFRLLVRMSTPRVAWLATIFFIAGPPSLVFWTLSGSAEIVMTWLAGVALLLAVEAWQRTRSPRAVFAAFAAIGAGLWVHQYILYFVVPIGIVLVAEHWQTLRGVTLRGWLRALLAIAIAVAVLYTVLGLIPFFKTGGVIVNVGALRIAVTHPQKMWWIAGEATVVALACIAIAAFGTGLALPALGFLTGYSPAIIGRIGNQGIGSPISRLDFAGLRHAWPDIAGVMTPMLFGFRDPTTARTVAAWLMCVLIFVAIWSYCCAWRSKISLRSVFHLLPIVAVAMFFVSGSYIDAQSYRYLMPIYAAIPVVYAVGLDAAWRLARPAGIALALIVVALFTAQQAAWYRHLQPDVTTPRVIACLDARGSPVARAQYWNSYTITFLTGERIIVTPVDGIDRYQPYSDSTPGAPIIEEVCR